MVSMSEAPLSTTATLYDAVRAIEASQRRIAVVVDRGGKLLGTLTDGDIRRCLLAGGTLQSAAVDAMNAEPLTATHGCTDAHLLDLMRIGNVMCIPIVDAAGTFKTLIHLRDLGTDEAVAGPTSAFAAAVIMAGGEGARLRPLTESIPKPMVEIGGMPLLERHIRRLSRVGIHTAYISVNYLSEVIEDHFGDGERFGIRIEYLREQTKLGTAGALSLLPAPPSAPLVVMNGDIVTRPDFASLQAYHATHAAAVTVAAVDYRVNIPYGVIRAEGPYVAGLQEKPSQRFLCNAGIYAVDPGVLHLIPYGAYYDMTDLIADCLSRGHKVAVYPMHEYWSDIGTADDLEKTRAAFDQMADQYE
jgi:dTDP-glucose pyrophosphorylase